MNTSLTVRKRLNLRCTSPTVRKGSLWALARGLNQPRTSDPDQHNVFNPFV
jgi:hypothetical protein